MYMQTNGQTNVVPDIDEDIQINKRRKTDFYTLTQSHIEISPSVYSFTDKARSS